MVYITNWQQFQEAAESLYEKSPYNTRYCVKWRGVEGLLVLKVTDNNTCLKYKTHSSIFLNRFETLNLNIMRKMQNKITIPSSAEGTQPIKTDGVSGLSGTSVGAQATSSATPVPGGPSSSGVKKKKGKKKK